MTGWLSLKKLREMGVTILGNNIKVSDMCRIYNPSNLILHDNIRIDDFTIISAKGKVEIFNYVHVASHCLLSCSTNIILNNYTAIASGSKLFGSNDDYGGKFMTNPTVPIKYTNVKSGDIVFEDHCIVGSNTIILPNVILKEGTSVGSNSFIHKTTEPWSIYIGTPVKKLKDRNRNCLLLSKELEHTLI